jgi:hypothetical protein
MVRREDRCAGAGGHRPRRWLLPRRLPPPVSHRLRVLAHQRDLAQLGRQFVRRRSSIGGHLAAALRGWCGSRVLGAVPVEAQPAAGARACRPGQIWASWARSRPHGPCCSLGAGGRCDCGGGLHTYDILGMVLQWFLGMLVRPSGWVV